MEWGRQVAGGAKALNGMGLLFIQWQREGQQQWYKQFTRAAEQRREWQAALGGPAWQNKHSSTVRWEVWGWRTGLGQSCGTGAKGRVRREAGKTAAGQCGG